MDIRKGQYNFLKICQEIHAYMWEEELSAESGAAKTHQPSIQKFRRQELEWRTLWRAIYFLT